MSLAYFYQRYSTNLTNPTGFSNLFGRFKDKSYVDVEVNNLFGCIKLHNCARVLINPDAFNENFAAHEFLHALLFEDGFPDQETVFKQEIENKPIESIFDACSIRDFINNIAHYRFYDMYCGLGFNKDEFVENIHSNNLPDTYVNCIIEKYKRNNVQMVNRFSSIYIVCKCNFSQVTQPHYNQILVKLSNIDKDLFQIFDNFFQALPATPIPKVTNLVNDLFAKISLLALP